MAKNPAPSSHSLDSDERSARFDAVDEQRVPRGSDVDATDLRAAPEMLSDFERMLEDEFEDVALPSPPPLAGWHLCWLTTSSQYDTMQKRARLGYEPVRQEELPTFVINNGSPDGYIKCNEMLLCKISEDRYQVLMRHFHHKKPLEDEASAFRKMKDVADTRDNGGNSVVQDEAGTITTMQAEINAAMRLRPTFA
jgi:hypothetical protein